MSLTLEPTSDVKNLLDLPAPASLYKELGRFPEGSAPLTTSERGQQLNILLRHLLGLAENTTFKVGMNGFGQHAGGLILMNRDKDYAHELVDKRDPYNKGKIGVIGGQGSDIDEGDDLFCALREKGEEIGPGLLDRRRLFPIVQTTEWRTTDSRIEGYWIKGTFFGYEATDEEIQRIRQGYAAFVETTGGSTEIDRMREASRQEVLELVRNGQMGYYDQSQAFLMTALCIPQLAKARHGLEAMGVTHPTTAMVWDVARALSQPRFEAIVVNPNWRPELNVDALMAA